MNSRVAKTAEMNPKDIVSIYPLSPLQEGMLFESLKNPEGGVYINHPELVLTGEVDAAALQSAWGDVINQFPVLRTAFAYKDRKQPLQIVFKTVALKLELHDYQGLDNQHKAARLNQLLQEHKRQGFDYSRAPLMRVLLIRWKENESRLIWLHHHLLMDGWSLPIVLEALNAAYAARKKGKRPDLKYTEPYESYIRWLKAQDQKQAQTFWQRYLFGFEQKTPLPLGPQAGVKQRTTGQKYGQKEFELSEELSTRLANCAREHRFTVNTLLQGAWGLLLSRYSNQTDVVFGSVSSGRSPQLPGADTIVGLLINTTAVRVKVNARLSVHEWLEELQHNAVQIQEYEYASLKDVQKWSDIPSGENLFDTLLAFENFPLEASNHKNSGLPIAAVKGAEQPHNSLTIACIPGDTLVFHLFYDEYYYTASAIERIFAHLKLLLGELTGDLSRKLAQISILEPPEREQLFKEWNATSTQYPREASLVQLFEAQAVRTPESVALHAGERQLSYRELNSQANRMARYIQRQGIQPGDRVGLLLERSLDTVVALLGVLKAGAVYVPLDPDLPAARLEYIAADSGVRFIVGDQPTVGPAGDAIRQMALASMELDALDDTDPGIQAQANQAVYVMYTSGSTGLPKGTVATHRSVARLVKNNRYLSLNQKDVLLHLAPLSFDASTLEIWGALLNGAKLVVAPAGHTSVQRLGELVQTHAVSVLWLTAAYFHLAVREDVHALRGVRALLAGGDVLAPQVVKKVLETIAGCTVINGYGPTENTTFTCCYPMESVRSIGPGAVPIGRPIGNTTVYVLDELQNPLPVGAVGELYTGGDGVCQGYLGNGRLTAERFLPDPFSNEPGVRLYRTGDLVRWRDDGVLEFVGRKDFQVKVRGYRIELEEIESVLNACHEVREAVVVARTQAEEQKILVAYYIARDNTHVTGQELREYLNAKLPSYMVPAFFVPLRQFPLNNNGKLDRNALPSPQLQADGDYAAPASKIEQQILDIWHEVLKERNIGVHDNLFELGGDSILCIQIASRLKKHGYDISVKDIFDGPTVHDLAKRCIKGQGTAGVYAPQEVIQGKQVLLPIQQWFYAQHFQHPNHWNQSFLLHVPEELSLEAVNGLVEKLITHHDALRLRFYKDPQGQHYIGEYALPEGGPWIVSHDLRACEAEKIDTQIQHLSGEVKEGLSLSDGPLLAGALFTLPAGAKRLLISIHHMVVDMVSWRVLLEDMETLYWQWRRGEELHLGAKTTPYQYWGKRLAEHSASPELQTQRDYWMRPELGQTEPMPLDFTDGKNGNTAESTRVVSVELDTEQTRELLEQVHDAYHTRIDDVLLCAMAQAYKTWSGQAKLLLSLESHGREDLFPDVDLARTVGWFTSMYPVLLECISGELGTDLITVKETLRAVPVRGIGYGLMAYPGLPSQKSERVAFGYGKVTYLTEENSDKCAQPQPTIEPEISFSYLGQFDQSVGEESAIGIVDSLTPHEVNPGEKRGNVLDIAGRVLNGRLSMIFIYSAACHKESTIQALAEGYINALQDLIQHCLTQEAGGWTPSDFPLAQLTQAQLDNVLGIVGKKEQPRQVESIYPLSPLQEGMLFESLKQPGTGIYITQPVMQLCGEVDTAALAQAWTDVIEHFPVLRTAFVYQGDQVLQVVLNSVDFSLQRLDWRGESEQVQRQKLNDLLTTEKCRDIDFTQAPLMSAVLVQFGDNEYHLVWTHHHILLDGWSMPRVVESLISAYEARLQGRRPALVYSEPYQSYISWLQTQDREQAQAFWREYLNGFEAKLNLPRVGGQAAQAGQSYQHVEYELSETLTRRLKDQARRQRLTLNTFIQAAWSLLLSRYTGETDIVFGAVSSGRPAELKGAETMVGLLINTVPVRLQLNKHVSLEELLQNLQSTNVQLRAYEYASLADIKRWSGITAGENLFDTIVAFENYPLHEAGARGAALPILSAQGGERPHNPLTLTCVPGSKLRCNFFYDDYYFGTAAIERLFGYLQHALELLVRDLSLPLEHIDIQPVQEKDFLLTQSAQVEKLHSHQTSDYILHRRFEERALSAPNAVALVYEGNPLSYGELNNRANRLAHYLRSQGVGAETLVGICLERSLELVVSIMGILKAGAAYVPLDPTYPQERLAFLQQDAGIQIILSEREYEDRLNTSSASVLYMRELQTALAACSTENPQVEMVADQLAYVIYTSGSTGRPKGVLVSHANVSRLFSSTQHWYGFNDADVWTLFHSYAFDFSVWELWGALLYGGRLVIVPYNVSRSPDDFRQLLLDEQVTVLNQTPSAFYGLMESATLQSKEHLRFIPSAFSGPMEAKADSPQINENLRYVIFGGEALDLGRLQSWYARYGDDGVQLINMYGITETTVHVTYQPLSPAQAQWGQGSIIGEGIDDLEIYVLDEKLCLAPLGVSGELYVGGAGLARGYLRRPALTAERFIPNPFSTVPGLRLYRTGDVVRWSENGALEYIGRKDFQVKVRGYRIELGEIEAELNAHEQIREAVVVAREDETKQKSLTAYYVVREGETVSAQNLREYLSGKLPSHMVPAQFMDLERMPLTASGKLDRKALPEATAQSSQRYAEPTKEVERVLTRIWQEALKTDQVGIDDNYFELGGDSILSIKIASQAKQAGIIISVKDIFAYPTIRELAGRGQQAPAFLYQTQDAIQGEQILLPIQRWFFDQGFQVPDHWNQSFLLEVPPDLSGDALHSMLGLMVEHHDALRLRFTPDEQDTGCTARYSPPVWEGRWVQDYDLSAYDAKEAASRIETIGYEVKGSLSLENGPLLRSVLFHMGDGQRNRLLLSIHHLVVDMVSWRILLEDFQMLYQQWREGQPLLLPDKSTPYQYWGKKLMEHAQSPQVREQVGYWTREELRAAAPLMLDYPEGETGNTVGSVRLVSMDLDERLTKALLEQVPDAYHTQINDILLCALARAYLQWSDGQTLLLDLEGHGREELFEEVDLARTVGWFTTLYPVLLQVTGEAIGEDIKSVKEQLREVPDKGITYGLLKYLLKDESVGREVALQPDAQISFSYLGQFDQTLKADSQIGYIDNATGMEANASEKRSYLIDIAGKVMGGELSFMFLYSNACHNEDSMQRLAQLFRDSLQNIITHCTSPDIGERTAEDFTASNLTEDILEDIYDEIQILE